MPKVEMSLGAFKASVDDLFEKGLLTIRVGTLDLDHLNYHRRAPYCPYYGYSRGTPIDRHYLNRFIAEIRDEVTGDTLEIGGRRDNRRLYGFNRVTAYKTMDLYENVGVDIVADAHGPGACRSNSMNTVLLFNVLEHCAQPWVVIRNIKKWLRLRGRVYCMVPNAQRVHRDPKDYWRILPDAFESLFSEFRILKLMSYGNLLTCIASLNGIAAEELPKSELDAVDTRYPVISCVVAEKPSQFWDF